MVNDGVTTLGASCPRALTSYQDSVHTMEPCNGRGCDMRVIQFVLLVAIGVVGYWSLVDHDDRNYANIYAFQAPKDPTMIQFLAEVRQNEDGPKKCKGYEERSFLYRLTDFDTGWCPDYLERSKNFPRNQGKASAE